MQTVTGLFRNLHHTIKFLTILNQNQIPMKYTMDFPLLLTHPPAALTSLSKSNTMDRFSFYSSYALLRLYPHLQGVEVLIGQGQPFLWILWCYLTMWPLLNEYPNFLKSHPPLLSKWFLAVRFTARSFWRLVHGKGCDTPTQYCVL